MIDSFKVVDNLYSLRKKEIIYHSRLSTSYADSPPPLPRANVRKQAGVSGVTYLA